MGVQQRAADVGVRWNLAGDHRPGTGHRPARDRPEVGQYRSTSVDPVWLAQSVSSWQPPEIPAATSYLAWGDRCPSVASNLPARGGAPLQHTVPVSDRAASDRRAARREAETPAPCAPPDDLNRDELVRVPCSIAADGSPVVGGRRTGPDRPVAGQGPARNRLDRPETGQPSARHRP